MLKIATKRIAGLTAVLFSLIKMDVLSPTVRPVFACATLDSLWSGTCREKAPRKENPSKVERATNYFGRIISGSVHEGLKMLTSGSGLFGGQSSDMSEVNVLSSTVAGFSRKEM